MRFWPIVLLLACAGDKPADGDSTPQHSGGDLDSEPQDSDPQDSGDSGETDDSSPPDSGAVDADGDGWPASSDCDDTNDQVHPNADEYCDEIDNDCDGATDESSGDVYYTDADLDGWGDPWTATAGCIPGAGYASRGGDCDDTDDDINPDAAEVCDLVDNDCDGGTDEDVEPGMWFPDADSDGYGVPVGFVVACANPGGYSASADDCDDTRANVYPGGGEVCDGLDNDCDGVVDDSATGASTWYVDTDRDGYGDADGASVLSCSQPGGYVADATDCDDGSAVTNPGRDELCDEQDNDCDGTVDEDAIDAAVYRVDADRDGFGDPTLPGVYRCDPGEGYVADDSDCDDTTAVVSPIAAEVCNGIDDNCDGEIDGTALTGTFYADRDADGYGDGTDWIVTCEAPSGYVIDNTDCDDADPTVHPTAPDVDGDGIDSNCDGSTESDRDGDGYDAIELGGNDCDDTRDDVYPGAPDTPYDGFDSDCSGGSDYDADGDGYVDEEHGGDDCDDGDATVYPGAPEINSIEDHDCDGVLEYGPTASATWDGRTSSLESCATLYLDGSASSDRESATLTYSWQAVSVPYGSAVTTASLVEETDESPSVFLDEPGDYTFSLQVTDGAGNNSAVDLVELEIEPRTSNVAPVAVASADQSASVSASCAPISYGAGGYDCDPCAATSFTLDGSGSYDGDGEPISYAWSVYSGDGTLLSSSSDSAVTVQVDEISAEYGTALTTTVVVRLEVTDCYGATSAPDPVTLTYTCTGS